MKTSCDDALGVSGAAIRSRAPDDIGTGGDTESLSATDAVPGEQQSALSLVSYIPLPFPISLQRLARSPSCLAFVVGRPRRRERPGPRGLVACRTAAEMTTTWTRVGEPGDLPPHEDARYHFKHEAREQLAVWKLG